MKCEVSQEPSAGRKSTPPRWRVRFVRLVYRHAARSRELRITFNPLWIPGMGRLWDWANRERDRLMQQYPNLRV